MTLETIKIYELIPVSSTYQVVSHSMQGEIRDIDGRKYGIVGKEHILRFIKNSKFVQWLLVDIESGMIIGQSNSAKTSKETFIEKWKNVHMENWLDYTKTPSYKKRVKIIKESEI